MNFLHTILCCATLLLVEAGSAQETTSDRAPATQAVPADAPQNPSLPTEPKKGDSLPPAQPPAVTNSPATPEPKLKPLTYLLLTISVAIGPILIIWLFRKNKRLP